MKRVLLIALCCVLTSNCTRSTEAPRNAPVASTSVTPPSLERMPGAVLYRAQVAFEQDDLTGLALALSQLDAVGLHPVGDEARDVLARWRAAAADRTHVTRGRVLGPGFMVGELGPREERVLQQTFLSGRRAAISLSSLETRSLEVTVRNRRDESLCREIAAHVTCHWIPLYTHRHTITLRNPNAKKTRYQLVID